MAHSPTDKLSMPSTPVYFSGRSASACIAYLPCYVLSRNDYLFSPVEVCLGRLTLCHLSNHSTYGNIAHVTHAQLTSTHLVPACPPPNSK
ncbi:hypothetical protein CY34DRAFT_721422 [Suillus luteus UH-Slu-Lm8-n1]|uniref:Uncharacterized protein n=1 Tax=Suillus luteus UH-Slu-Lm8-n1 TaxID=930992 RepID=A0A0D0BJ24_9AGAM|nr:hypothetical protein CY34DRAFT_721422 [Suillus luteus UH-Slu-Lm8-n1]